MNDVWHRVLAQCEAGVCLRADLVNAHEHSIVHHPTACRCVQHRVTATRAYACATERWHATLHAGCARTRFSRMPAQSSDQAWAI